MKTSFTLFAILLLITSTRAIACTVPPTTSEATITASGPTTFCNYHNGGWDYEYGSVNLTVATSGLAYQWKKNSVTISGATNQTYTSGETGSFTCDVSNDCGTTTSNAIPTTSLGIPYPIITASGPTAFCSGDSVILSATDTFSTYLWGLNFHIAPGNYTSRSYTAKEPGLYILNVTNMCTGGSSNPIYVTIGSPSSSAATISSTSTTVICGGNSVVLSVAGAGYSYQWKNNGSIISGATQQSYSANAAGSYSCDVSNNCGATPSNSISVTIITSPPASADAMISAGSTTTFCNGGSVVLSVSTPGLLYQWKNNGSNISAATQQQYTATASGNYSCDVGNNCGITSSNSISVTVLQLPTSAEASIAANGPTNFCNAVSVVLSVATSGFTYQWKNNGSYISGATNQSYTATSAATYTCEVTNSCGTVVYGSIVIKIQSPLTSAQASISATGSTTRCSGQGVSLRVATIGLNYQWKNNGSVISGATKQSYSASSTGSYSCVVSNSCGSITSNAIAVTINPAPTSTVTAGSCSGGTVTLTDVANPNTGVKYNWTKNNVKIAGSNHPTYAASQSGSYACQVSINATGCKSISAAVNVTINCKVGDVVNDEEVIIYPNPTSNYFNINTTQLDPQSVIFIYDLTGRMVESDQINGEEMKVGEALANGVYFLKIVGNHEATQVIKLVKKF